MKTSRSRRMCAYLGLAPLDLDITLGCGQTFRWKRDEKGTWSGPIGNQLVSLSPRRGGVEVRASPGGHNVLPAVSTYLRADDDVEAIHRRLARNSVLGPAVSAMRGLRVIKMDEWECLVSYVLATYANIPRIGGMIERISRSYGKHIAGQAYSFPSLEDLRRASSEDLRGLGLGYRANHVEGLCQVLDKRSINRMTSLGYDDLRSELLELPGVGDKVADCVCLFGFGHLESFPIDVWVMRSLKRLFGIEGSYNSLRRIARDRFGEFAGYAQEYLFFNERCLASKGACLFERLEI